MEFKMVKEMENMWAIHVIEAGEVIGSEAFDNFKECADRYVEILLENGIETYIDDSEKFKADRKTSIAGIIAPNESTFTNIIQSDTQLLVGKTKGKQKYIIRFDNGKDFVVCEGGIITKQKYSKYSNLRIVAMRPYLVGVPYYKEDALEITTRAQERLFKFDMLITLKQFYSELKLLKQ